MLSGLSVFFGSLFLLFFFLLPCPNNVLHITMFFKTYRLGKLILKPLVCTGSILEATAFDTSGDSSAGNKLRDYLNGISGE